MNDLQPYNANANTAGGTGQQVMEPMTRMEVFKEVSHHLPRNEYGLPKFLYRPDLIPQDLFNQDLESQSEVLTAATVDILWREGYPTLEDGTAIWSQLPFEPEESYNLFSDYLEMGDTQGVRRMEQLTKGELYPHHQGFDKHVISEYHTYYYWASRSRAYDLFQVVQHKKLREKRILSTTNRHYLQAEKLLGKIEEYFQRRDDETGELEWMLELTPKVALDYLEKLYKIQRVSLGLPAHGLASGEDNDTPPHANVEVHLRQLTKGQADSAAGGGLGDDIDLLLSDPDTAAAAQELILKMSVGTKS